MFKHRLRDFDSVFRADKKMDLLKYIIIRSWYKILGKDENDLKEMIPDSYSSLKGFRFLSRGRTLDFLFYSKYYEPETTNYLLKNSGRIFLDIGSHIGRFAVLGSKKFKKVFAFEANPKNYEILVKNLKINSIENVTPINLAISNKEKNLLMDMPDLNTGATRISEKGNIKTKSVTLDKFLKKRGISYGEVDFLLIDVEGHEDKVFDGGNKFLKKTNAKIIVECFDIEKIEKQLGKYGYKKKKCFDFYNYLFVK